MKVEIMHPIENGKRQYSRYENVLMVKTEYQPNNGKGGSFWLKIYLECYSKEWIKFRDQGGFFYEEFDPKTDTLEIIGG